MQTCLRQVTWVTLSNRRCQCSSYWIQMKWLTCYSTDALKPWKNISTRIQPKRLFNNARKDILPIGRRRKRCMQRLRILHPIQNNNYAHGAFNAAHAFFLRLYQPRQMNPFSHVTPTNAHNAHNIMHSRYLFSAFVSRRCSLNFRMVFAARWND